MKKLKNEHNSSAESSDEYFSKQQELAAETEKFFRDKHIPAMQALEVVSSLLMTWCSNSGMPFSTFQEILHTMQEQAKKHWAKKEKNV
jgi:hypothetical protein